MEDKMKVKIMNMEKVLYEGEAISLTSNNDVDTFDILPGHINFITIVKNNIKVKTNDNKELKFDIEYGVLLCDNYSVNVYIGMDSAVSQNAGSAFENG